MKILPLSVSSAIPTAVRRTTKRLLQQFFYSGLIRVSGGMENALLWSYGQFDLSPDIILKGYLQGIYPLPNMFNGKIIEWYDPELRGIIPTQDFKVRSDLLRCLKKEKFQEIDKKFEIRIDTNYQETIIACSKPRKLGPRTWLTADYIKASIELHHMGFTHSIETYQNGILVGGVIGIAINGFFNTLSLFHSVDNASKVAFYYLLVKLREEGYKLHVSGDVGNWFSQYGMIGMEKKEFRKEFREAITSPVTFSSKVPELVF